MKFLSRYTLLILIVAVVLSRLLAISQTDTTSVYTTPLIDDSYYYFALGEHLAEGIGIKVDRIHDTTGFQPLWGFLLAIPYKLFPNNQTTPITAIQIIGLLVSVGTTTLIFILAGSLTNRLTATIVTGLIMLSPYSISTSINGMETGLAILMVMAIFLCFYHIYQHPQTRILIITGLVCGAAFLARVDTAILTASILLIMFLRPPQPGQRIQTITIVAFSAVIPIIPWALITFSMGKFIVPESGEAVRLLASLLRGTNATPMQASALSIFSSETLKVWGQKFIQFLAEFANRVDFSALYHLLPVTMGQVGVFLTVLGITLLASLPILISSRKPPFRTLVLALGIYVIAMLVVYPILVQSDWFFNRYVAPISAAFTFFSALYFFKSFGSGFAKFARIGLLALCVLTYIMILFTDGAYKWIIYGNRARASESHYNTAEWINANIPANDMIGGFQTGLIGYYSHPTVINLDGKVNADARNALMNAQMGDYLCSTGVKYVVDQRMIIQHLLIERTSNWNNDALKLIYTGQGDPDDPMLVYKFNCDALIGHHDQ